MMIIMEKEEKGAIANIYANLRIIHLRHSKAHAYNSRAYAQAQLYTDTMHALSCSVLNDFHASHDKKSMNESALVYILYTTLQHLSRDNEMRVPLFTKRG